MKFYIRLHSSNFGDKNGICWLGINYFGNPYHTTIKEYRQIFDTPDEAIQTMRAVYKTGFDFNSWTIIMDDKYVVRGINNENFLIES